MPHGTVAVANGDLLAHARAGWTTFRWSADEPMASYLAMAASGNYRLTVTRAANGLPIINAVDRDLSPAAQAETAASLARQPQMIAYFSRLFGPYPFSSFGAIVDDDEDARLRAGEPDPTDLLAARAARVDGSPTSSPTSGTATASPRSAGGISGSTKGLPPTPSGCGPSSGAGTRSRSSSTPPTRVRRESVLAADDR